MAYMARATYSESGQLLDSGVDLNMEGGIAEWVFRYNVFVFAVMLLYSMKFFYCLLHKAFFILFIDMLRT